MISGDPEVSAAAVSPSTPRSKVGGRRARVAFAAVAVVVGALIAYGTQHRLTTGVRSLVSPFAAAAKSPPYASNPPIGQMVVLADPSSQLGMQPSQRSWTVVWISAGGQLCGVIVKHPVVNESFCARVGESLNVPSVTGLVVAATLSDNGHLWLVGNVPPEVTSVTATSSAGPTATAKVVTIPTEAGASAAFFALTLDAADRSLGAVRFEGADASGRVVVTRTTDALGR